MKTSRFFTMALCAMVVAMGATSCKKDNNGNAGDRMTIGANIGQHGGDGAKTAIGPEDENQFPILWSDGDAFTLYSQSSTEGTTFGITSGVDSESAVFEGANPGDAPYFASYPDGDNGVTRTDGTTFTYQIPQDQSGLNHAGPMVGYSADGKSVSFDNAMSWVRIGLKGEAKVTKVEMSYSEAKGTPVPLSGTLTITVDGNGGITNTSVAANRKAEAQKLYKDCDVTLTAGYAYFDFLVPAGAFGGSTEAKFKVFGTDNVQLAAFNKTMPEIERNKVYVGEYGEAINEPAATPVFTVGMNGDTPRTVEFSPGNLYWDGSAFHFEANQWSFASTWNTSHVSHFFWSNTTDWQTSGKEPYASSYSYSTQTMSDVFFTEAEGFKVGNEAGWRTLSKDEWNYLLNSRTNASFLRAWKDLGNNVKGLVILPDGTENPSTVMGGITSTSDLASSGAVFLPAAGYRFDTDMNSVGSYGLYWSSTPHEGAGDYAYCMYFDSGTIYDVCRYYGNAVRLVR